MNMTTTEAAANELCASCGVAGGGDGDIELKNCAACKSVKYCSINCQRNHRAQHKRACKKRAAELKDELLFKQPESTSLGDCPICLLPMPLFTTQDTVRFTIYDCCSKVVCNGCIHANDLREKEARLPSSCPFCRNRRPKKQAEMYLNLKKRAALNDPVALYNVGTRLFESGDCAAAIEYFKKAAELGDVDSHYQLSCVYHGMGGVQLDGKKDIYHAEQAAIGGHLFARYNLGLSDWKNGKTDRAVKHWIIAANLGDDASLNELKKGYRCGVVSKEDFAAALRAHQAAVDATKSPQRDAAETDL